MHMPPCHALTGLKSPPPHRHPGRCPGLTNVALPAQRDDAHQHHLHRRSYIYTLNAAPNLRSSCLRAFVSLCEIQSARRDSAADLESGVKFAIIPRLHKIRFVLVAGCIHGDAPLARVFCGRPRVARAENKERVSWLLSLAGAERSAARSGAIASFAARRSNAALFRLLNKGGSERRAHSVTPRREDARSVLLRVLV